MTLIQYGWPFNDFLDFTAVRLASLHTVINPWLYPLTRRKYRDAFCYLLTLSAYYVTCSLVTKPSTSLGKCVVETLAEFLFTIIKIKKNFLPFLFKRLLIECRRHGYNHDFSFLDEIVGAQFEASQVRELCREERRRSSSQRLVK